jgi:hypothetical protein
MLLFPIHYAELPFAGIQKMIQQFDRQCIIVIGAIPAFGFHIIDVQPANTLLDIFKRIRRAASLVLLMTHEFLFPSASPIAASPHCPEI